MNTRPELNIDGFIDNIITSYETRIQKIQTAFESSENITESSHSLFDNVHNSLNELKKERNDINLRLCENLAKNGSLRKKDYNSMMSGILTSLDTKEQEAEVAFLAFIEAQKEIAHSLRNTILDIKDMTSPEAGKKIELVKEQLAMISGIQEVRKEKVMKIFTDFQEMHNSLTACLEKLLEKGTHIQIQDIKNVKDQIIRKLN